MIDEAANVAPLRKLDKIASAGSGPGILLVDVWQDLGQIENIYGDERSRVVLSNHTSTIFLSGVKDEKTLRTIGFLLDSHQTHHRSESIDGRGSRSHSLDWRDEQLAPPSYLRQLPADMGVVIVGRFKPMRLRLRGWYEDKALRQLGDPSVAASYDDLFAPTRRRRLAGSKR